MRTPVWSPEMAKLPGTKVADTQVRPYGLSAVVKPDARARHAALAGTDASPLPQPWTLPPHGLAVFQGETPRLSHYFLPRLLLEGKRVLFLDGANCADPRLLERLARQRRVPFEQFNRQVQIARAFTCFQLTELIARVPQFLADFPAQVLLVTAFPELYFDEDVRDWDACVAFAQALANLRRLASVAAVEGKHCLPDRRSAGLQPGIDGACILGRGGLCPPAGAPSAPLPKPECRPVTGTALPLAVAVFSAAPSPAGLAPSPARQCFFNQVCAAASEVWKFTRSEDNRLGLICSARLQAGTNRVPPPRGALWAER